MAETVHRERHGEVLALCVDHPPVNALSRVIREALLAGIRSAHADPDIWAVVIVGRDRTFIAGADIREFGKPRQPPFLSEIIAAVEDSLIPVVAALHGTALGGGFELALGCHYRVALANTRVGLPEVKLGLLPGAGGTQRLPRLVGAARALELITSGRHVLAPEALELGMIDEISTLDSPLEAGMAAARRLLAENRPIRRVGELDERIAAARGDTALFEKYRTDLAASARGLFSPLKIVDAVQAAVALPFREGLQRERELFEDCMASPQRAALIHVFFAERQVARPLARERVEPRALRHIGVIGGGTMGAGIAVALLTAGYRVSLMERDPASLARGQERVAEILAESVKRAKLDADERERLLDEQFSTTLSYVDLGAAELVIEAVFEDLAVKQAVFQELGAVMPAGAILATNTSYLDVNQIAAVTANPGRVLGLHFFSPAHIMKLLEVVVADHCDPQTVATGFALAKRLNKVAVRAGVCDGFIGNRILATLRKVADYMVLDGASPQQVDQAIYDFGYPMGPYTMTDMAGLDISWANRKRLAPSRDPAERYAHFSDRLCERGWFGRKSGQGYYCYPPGASGGEPNPEALALIEAERRELGIQPRDFSTAEIQRRYLSAMIMEATRVVEEGIARRPLDVDVVQVYGYGFPRWRGGPLHYADQLGLARVLADIRELAAEDAHFWRVPVLLEHLLARGENFASLNQDGDDD